MDNKRAIITGIEAFLPEYILTNEEISTMVDTTDEWIMTRIGVKERRILKEDGLGTSYMGAEAVKRLLEKTKTNADDVDMLLCATVTPDMLFPATANIICDKVGIKNAWGYDINAGCSGFLFSFATATSFIRSRQAKKIVLVTGERMSSITDYQDRTTCPLFGDAAVAMLIEPCADETLGLQDQILHVDGIGRHYLYQRAGGSLYPPTEETIIKREHYIHQDGQTVFKYAVSRMADVSVEIMEKHALKADDIAYLIPHQANMRIIEATGKRMGLSSEKILINIEKFGNTAGTSIPLVLWEFEKKFKKGDTLIFSAFGAGFTWGSIYYKWAYNS
ncbi:MAG: ketoacyl-ACP synthase III [Bacteroidales bacterium]|nr:ketoacyl-ACP synthase III [Bacteroidales bacterium]MDD2280429.1 ketoacyl-ACP synthase III [Bacteroidales bacterium]MDD4293486.1 ketoacyl-ACP synthase III [Bacteroidales bacterium]MDD4491964.1 ketoacyl-ACP synthase III [Bacteroidales bacterium]HNW48637.1 beta-ketoacyl-ACP synthase III [Bacteroidales bacterium]